MWKDHEDDKDSEKRRKEKGKRFRTVVAEAKDMEVFETEELASDEDSSDQDPNDSMV